MVDLSKRISSAEWMDDLDGWDEDLRVALHELPRLNRWLGGYTTFHQDLFPFLSDQNTPVTILDLGTGLGDVPALVLNWAQQHRRDVRVVAVDANPHIVAYGAQHFAENYPLLKDRVRFERADISEFPYSRDAFDVVLASLFLHHFDDNAAVDVLSWMSSVARCGLIVNDLHRHWMALAGIQAVVRTFRMSPMVRNDGPLSVRRAFTREDLERLAAEAGLSNARVEWYWAFRWSLCTLPVSKAAA